MNIKFRLKSTSCSAFRTEAEEPPSALNVFVAGVFYMMPHQFEEFGFKADIPHVDVVKVLTLSRFSTSVPKVINLIKVEPLHEQEREPLPIRPHLIHKHHSTDYLQHECDIRPEWMKMQFRIRGR